MDTPICDFVSRYAASGFARFHMPGHKGRALLGPEPFDLTEIRGADELYRSAGIIRRSEENAAALFGAGRTVYSAEGSSLSIRAMLVLAVWRAAERGLPKRLLAGRNAHRVLLGAAALLDVEVEWLFPEEGEGLLSCTVNPERLAERLREGTFMGVYLTSPDYLGRLAPVDRLAEVCHAFGVPLLVDNAHGAYLKFLTPDRHPLTLGADLCCDSAHKTLPCLTGAGYLHIGARSRWPWADRAEEAMALFASTSPSYLILQSLDRANRELAGEYQEKLRRTAARLTGLKAKLADQGWAMTGEEPMKLTLLPREMGWYGTEAADRLRQRGIEAEFADPEYVTLMPSAETTEAEWQRLEEALTDLSGQRGTPVGSPAPDPGRPVRVCGLREALLSPAERVPVEEALGRILADPEAGCPPAVPVRMPGERIDEAALRCFRYWGQETLRCLPRGYVPKASGKIPGTPCKIRDDLI